MPADLQACNGCPLAVPGAQHQPTASIERDGQTSVLSGFSLNRHGLPCVLGLGLSCPVWSVVFRPSRVQGWMHRFSRMRTHTCVRASPLSGSGHYLYSCRWVCTHVPYSRHASSSHSIRTACGAETDGDACCVGVEKPWRAATLMS